jgi:hypothetical protein
MAGVRPSCGLATLVLDPLSGIVHPRPMYGMAGGFSTIGPEPHSETHPCRPRTFLLPAADDQEAGDDARVVEGRVGVHCLFIRAGLSEEFE